MWPYVSPSQEYKTPITVGDEITFEAQASNRGKVPLSGVTILYQPPDGAVVVSAPQCSVDVVVICRQNTLGLQAVLTAQIVVRFTRAGTFDNAFLVSQLQKDDDKSDDLAVATIAVAPEQIETPSTPPAPKGVRRTGTARNNTLTGTKYADVLRGLAGNDVLRALAGNDSLDGGAGNDSLDGGAGNDTLIGGAGNDRIVGGAGKDTIRCGAGKDTVIGARGDKVAKDCEKRR